MKHLAFILLLLVMISCDGGFRYKIHNNRVYFVEKSSLTRGGFSEGYETLIEKADASSFKELQYLYAKDRNHVYSEGRLIEKANPKTFKIIDDKNIDQYYFNSYSKDDKLVFYQGELIVGADAKTFHFLKEKPYAKDNKDYYFINKPLHVSNVEDFKLYLVNKHSQYKTYYTNDTKHFYIDTLKFEIQDFKTYNYMANGYAKDKMNVYYCGIIIKDADPKTFTMGKDSGHPRDKNFKFSGLEKFELTDTMN